MFLSGKSAIVTGSTSGIGLAIANSPLVKTAIAGEDAFRVMDILEARCAISHRILPGCFSHQVWRV